jgi:hypothetical protein
VTRPAVGDPVLSEGGGSVHRMTDLTSKVGSWADLEREAPELAADVRACFAVRKHCTLATLRRDGAPRISGTEVQLEPGGVFIGSMPRARKALDLQRDPRLAIHSPTVDPPEGRESEWAGEAKLAGVAVEVPPEDPADPSHRFRIDLTEVVHTKVDESATGLVITSWHPGRGVQQVLRR